MNQLARNTERGTAMNKFTFTYPTKVHYGEGIASEALRQELPKAGKTVMLAYGGGSLKKKRRL